MNKTLSRQVVLLQSCQSLCMNWLQILGPLVETIAPKPISPTDWQQDLKLEEGLQQLLLLLLQPLFALHHLSFVFLEEVHPWLEQGVVLQETKNISDISSKPRRWKQQKTFQVLNTGCIQVCVQHEKDFGGSVTVSSET